jgi:hypothetical protein
MATKHPLDNITNGIINFIKILSVEEHVMTVEKEALNLV